MNVAASMGLQHCEGGGRKISSRRTSKCVPQTRLPPAGEIAWKKQRGILFCETGFDMLLCERAQTQTLSRQTAMNIFMLFVSQRKRIGRSLSKIFSQRTKWPFCIKFAGRIQLSERKALCAGKIGKIWNSRKNELQCQSARAVIDKFLCRFLPRERIFSLINVLEGGGRLSAGAYVKNVCMRSWRFRAKHHSLAKQQKLCR